MNIHEFGGCLLSVAFTIVAAILLPFTGDSWVVRAIVLVIAPLVGWVVGVSIAQLILFMQPSGQSHDDGEDDRKD